MSGHDYSTLNDTTISIPNDQSDTNGKSVRQISYIILQASQVLSLLAYLFVGSHLLSFPQHLRKTLNLHVICVLLLINFIQLVTDMSMALQYLNAGLVRPSIDATCTTWMFIDSFTYYLSLLLMAWASFERHLFVFHSTLFNTKSRRFLLHYLPIMSLCLYAFVYYIFVDFLYQCVNTFDLSLAFCGLVCYMNLPVATVFQIEMMAHQVLPTFLIARFSSGLIIRTVLSRRRLQQSIEWRKYGKMITQLISASIVYLLFSVPFSLNPIAQLAGRPTPFAYDVYLNIFSYWAYGICIFSPSLLPRHYLI